METTRCRLEIEPLDLGTDARAVSLELLDPASREPVTGTGAAQIWAAALPALAGEQPWALDFFAHVDSVRDFCRQRDIPFHQANSRLLVVPAPDPGKLAPLLERFAGETFGARAGEAVESGDDALEGGLAQRGVDGYHPALGRYFFCAVCDLENGFLTVLSERLWASEVIRRLRAALSGLPVEVARPR